MKTHDTLDRHSRAMAAAKLAVRSYARNPSETNAEQVSLAWRRVRDLNSVATRRWVARDSQRPASALR